MLLWCQEVTQDADSVLQRALTVQMVDVRTGEFRLLRPTESLKINSLLADEDELNSSSAPQNQRA